MIMHNRLGSILVEILERLNYLGKLSKARIFLRITIYWSVYMEITFVSADDSITIAYIES